MAVLIKTQMSVQDYLESELTADVRHEYVSGEIREMPGGNETHSLVKVNVVTGLRLALRGKPHKLYNSDLKIKLPKVKLYTYPDASVVVGESLFEGTRRDALLNPRVIVEVLSKSTESYDRGEKFEHYQTLESFGDYLLASQTSYRVEHYLRQADDTWLMKIYRGLESKVILASLDCELTLADIYEGVTLPSSQDV
jgi:Uma2 family endonuclease